MGLHGPRPVMTSVVSQPRRSSRPRTVRRWIDVVAAIFLSTSSLGACSLYGQTCCTHPPTGAPGGLSREAAIARARAIAPGSGSSTTVVWASIETDPFAPRGSAPPGPLVWMVRLQGSLHASPCPSGFLDRPASPSDAACLDHDGGIDVVLDYFTGDLVGWTH